MDMLTQIAWSALPALLSGIVLAILADSKINGIKLQTKGKKNEKRARS